LEVVGGCEAGTVIAGDADSVTEVVGQRDTVCDNVLDTVGDLL
jgi:hypothetical protein